MSRPDNGYLDTSNGALEIDRAEPDEVEFMPRNNSIGKPNRKAKTDRAGQIVPEAAADPRRVERAASPPAANCVSPETLPGSRAAAGGEAKPHCGGAGSPRSTS